jgi:hypothetical protein
MKKLLYVILLIPSMAYAKEDVECSKKHSDVHLHCNFHKSLTVSHVDINGGDCASFDVRMYVPAGYHWVIPNTDSCHYISGLTLYTKEGNIYKFAPL